MSLTHLANIDAILERAAEPLWKWTMPTGAANPYVGQPSTRACACVGGPNCCMEVAKREHEANIRADERRKVLAEIEAKITK